VPANALLAKRSMSGRFCNDGNVPVYFRDASEPDKEVRAAKLLDKLWRYLGAAAPVAMVAKGDVPCAKPC
jgi:hypothetical protein